MQTDTLLIRPIEQQDNLQMAKIIREVMTAYGAVGDGFSINDPEVDQMYEFYQEPGCSYLVLSDGLQVLGGGGIGPLVGADPGICELKKMYFLPSVRGRGMGLQMVNALITEAQHLGYQTCYLETLERMTEAKALYQKMGFKKLCGQLGNTGHGGCDSFYSKEIA
ncbi:GNAT family N-acetyltransferase [Haliscomenobacter hydrossis]|uniref:GCN5-related N-acetyltransferase n=1 Tax=Haliscomenobacter hydrossis (strain ATCC 27775 / DSM 1100 / LMG 10767 / O) TaxID=760192 RepID=F4L688_HALH1|nr:GNAT family N-acetyltransferase [Haliscomenobacter hydrossis]AEE54106.1 GCN5-related N-acetyltransferase [Haliscomenobacter hydrossis DSM 1100]